MLSVLGASLGAQSAPQLRIGVLVDDDRVDMRRGVTLGADEARHVAKLLGREVIVIDLAAQPDAGVDALIVATSRPLPLDSDRGITVLRLGGPAGSRSELTLAPPDTGTLKGARRLVAWHGSLERYGAGQLNDRYRTRFGAAMSEDAWLGWFAAKLLWEAAARAKDRSPGALRRYLADTARRFDGHKGVGLRFGPDGVLQQPLYATP